jgi:hypothetical protein
MSHGFGFVATNTNVILQKERINHEERQAGRLRWIDAGELK